MKNSKTKNQIANEKANNIIISLKNGVEKQKEELLWADLYQYCQSKVKAISRSLNYQFNSSYTEEDLHLDVMENLFVHYEKFDPEKGSFQGWFNSIVRNTYVTWYDKNFSDDKRRSVPTIPMYKLTDDGSEVNCIDDQVYQKGAEESFMHRSAWKELMKEMEMLPENYRKALELCGFQGLKPAEAAKELNCSPEDVYRWLNRARSKMNKATSQEVKDALFMELTVKSSKLKFPQNGGFVA